MAEPPRSLPAHVAPATVEALLDRTGALVYVLDAEERVVATSATFRYRTEVEVARLATLQTLCEALYPDAPAREAVALAHRKALAGGPARPAEWTMVTGLGEPRQVRWQMILQGTSTDRLLFVVGEDLTERRRLEHWVRLQNLLLEQVSDAVVVLDPAGSVVHWAGGAAALLGVDASAALERSFLDFLPPGEGAARVEQWFRAVETASAATEDVELRTITGEPVDARVHLARLRDEGGADALLALRITRRPVEVPPSPTPASPPWERALAQVGLVGMVLTSPDGTVLTWSLGAERIAATSAAKAVGRRLFEEVLPIAGLGWEAVWNRVGRRGRYQSRVTVERPNGTQLAADLDASPVRGEDGSVGSVLVLLVDRGEAQERVEEALTLKSRAVGALVADGAQRWLLDGLAAVEPDHRAVMARMDDLRTLARLIAAGAPREEQERWVRARRLADRDAELGEAVARLAEATHRLRALGEAAARFFASEPDAPGPVRLDLELETARGLLGPAISGEIEVGLQLAELPAVRASRAPLLRGLCLLLLCAAESLRETADPKLTVEARAAGGWAHLDLRDNGTGVSLEVQSHLGDLAWLAAQRGYGPLFLGLAREAVRLAGGTLEIGGAAGTGTHLRASFPLAEAAAAVQPLEPPVPAPGAHGRVVVVEDDPLLRRALERAVAEAHEVDSFATVDEAVSAALTRGYDAAVVAFAQPDRLGLALLEKLMEAQPALARNLVVLVPPGVRPSTREVLLGQGLVVLSTPVDLVTLRSVLLRMLPAEELQLDEGE